MSVEEDNCGGAVCHQSVRVVLWCVEGLCVEELAFLGDGHLCVLGLLIACGYINDDLFLIVADDPIDED